MKNFLPALVLFFSFFIINCQKKYSVEKVDVTLSKRPELISNGKSLTMNLCGPCHYNPDTRKLSGRQMLDIPKAIGKIYASSLTNDSIHGIQEYEPGELKYLLKTGIKKNGEFSPFMVKPNLADSDIEAIIAFLRSPDSLVSPVGLKQNRSKYTLPGKIAVNHIFNPVKYTRKPIERPSNFDTVALGRYLVDVIGCFECHSANFLKIDKLTPENSKGYMAGGNKIKAANGTMVKAPNLTFDKETGIGNWSEQDFSKALIKGFTRDMNPLSYPMPIYSYLSNEESIAIYKYLKSIPPVKNSVKRIKKIKSVKSTGALIYEKYSCSACHGKAGKGVADLTKALYKYTDDEIVSLIKSPPSNTGMPPFEGLIKAEEYPHLIRYVKELGRKASIRNKKI